MFFFRDCVGTIVTPEFTTLGKGWGSSLRSSKWLLAEKGCWLISSIKYPNSHFNPPNHQAKAHKNAELSQRWVSCRALWARLPWRSLRRKSSHWTPTSTPTVSYRRCGPPPGWIEIWLHFGWLACFIPEWPSTIVLGGLEMMSWIIRSRKNRKLWYQESRKYVMCVRCFHIFCTKIFRTSDESSAQIRTPNCHLEGSHGGQLNSPGGSQLKPVHFFLMTKATFWHQINLWLPQAVPR